MNLVFKGRICGTTQMLPPPQGFSFFFLSVKSDWETGREQKSASGSWYRVRTPREEIKITPNGYRGQLENLTVPLAPRLLFLNNNFPSYFY